LIHNLKLSSYCLQLSLLGGSVVVFVVVGVVATVVLLELLLAEVVDVVVVAGPTTVVLVMKEGVILTVLNVLDEDFVGRTVLSGTLCEYLIVDFAPFFIFTSVLVLLGCMVWYES